MNERIKTLALTMPNVYSIEYENGTKGIEFTEEAFERFAELIVEECTDIAKHHVMNISTYSDAEFVGERIKEHFGVESRK